LAKPDSRTLLDAEFLAGRLVVDGRVLVTHDQLTRILGSSAE
jgi:hypothetical protein